ncbi:hypothetical protein OG592_02160 [Streptomyces avidinii]|uniref:hypothetical protein n=1 Tax=Streptomyces avidinii TaxID=1895 RepID=UPI0038682914|nr:hypothetical protein OG592_02160 [Streptomyces avidinii]
MCDDRFPPQPTIEVKIAYGCPAVTGGDLIDLLLRSSVMQISAQHLERSRDKHNPDIDNEAAQVAAALALRVVPAADLVIRLHAAASKTEPDYVVIDDDGQAFDQPFGEHVEPRHGGWR